MGAVSEISSNSIYNSQKTRQNMLTRLHLELHAATKCGPSSLKLKPKLILKLMLLNKFGYDFSRSRRTFPVGSVLVMNNTEEKP